VTLRHAQSSKGCGFTLWKRPSLYTSPEAPADFPSWLTGQGKVTCFPYTNHYKGNRNDHDWFTPIENHSSTPGARGFASENTAMAMKRQGLTGFSQNPSAQLLLSPSDGVWASCRQQFCLLISQKYLDIGAFPRLETLGEHSMCLSPMFPTRILLILLIFLEY